MIKTFTGFGGRRTRGWQAGWLLACMTFLLIADIDVLAQEGSSIPPEYRGTQSAVARGILDGNLIETNFRNHGEVARWDDAPWGIWPRNIGGRHIDGIAMIVAGLVRGERDKWSHLRPEWAGRPDTLLNPVSINYRSAGAKTGPDGNLWGWLPLGLDGRPGFHNPNRVNPVTNAREPNPALSDDPTSWPAFWPDKLDEEDIGWEGSWNGAFGKGVFQADLESYYVVDDYTDREYHIDPQSGLPFSQYGVYYPDPADSLKGGMGLQVAVRIFQWANVLAEDTMFLIYRITNTGQTDHGNQEIAGDDRETGLWFTQFVDYGLGEEEGDENAAFNPQLDIAYGFDQDGIGQRPSGGTYELGYTGFAFLESPANRDDGIDNDEDGITDESRFSGPGVRIEGQAAIRAFVEQNYHIQNFVRFNTGDENASLDEALQTRRAYRAGVWWTGDENMDWLGYDDRNGNGQFDPGELLNDDFGRDGLGPFDINYPGPDIGEADGIPTEGEPNFDELDVDESDQIGLTGFDLNSRPFYESGTNLQDDEWMWERIRISQFPVGEKPQQLVADVEPFLNFSSGPVNLPRQSTDFFSTAWLFGADEDDFFKNREVVQQIYNADYRFAQPPIMPTLTAQPGDGYIILSWDTLSLASYDRFSQTFDFEGYKLYKGTDPLLSDARVITDYRGTATFYRPIAQWDLRNEYSGRVAVMGNDAVYNLGNNTGLQFSYVDNNVINGKTYYYALVAYDHGFQPGEDDPDPNSTPIDPQENTFNISIDQGGTLRGFSQNVAIVTPRSDAAGFIRASTVETLTEPHGTLHPERTLPLGTGSLAVTVVNSDQVPSDAVFRLTFFDTLTAGSQIYETVGYQLENLSAEGEDRVLIPRAAMRSSTPVAAGITIDIQNDEPALDIARSGWVGVDSNGNPIYARNPQNLPGYETNWNVTIRDDESTFASITTDQYLLHWTTDSLYTTDRFTGGFIATEIPVWCTNLRTGEQCGLLVLDTNLNEEFDIEDQLVINERVGRFGPRLFRHRISFTAPGASFAPQNGAQIRISKRLPFATGDYFQFSIQEAHVDADLARDQLKDVAVVPNPYVLAAEWEPRTQIAGRGPRMIQFINLPVSCTIRIFTIRGELVQTIHHDGIGGDGAAWWDLMSQNGQDIAYGMYLYHVEAPGIGEKTGKFAVVK